MKFSRTMSAAVVLAMASATLVPVAYTADDEAVVRTQKGITYVSGGVGDASTERLNSLARDFNLKLVFALKSGDFLSGVDVTIADASGNTLVNTKSDGPVMLARLPAGNFQVAATFSGKTESRKIVIGAEKMRTVDFRWAAE